ncbi:retrovirus-related pol polyprotein from transposon TNT 1-94 [Tanacetum coccineum]
MQQPMPNPDEINDPTTSMNMELVLIDKAFKLNYSTPTNNNQRISSNPRNRQIAQPSMNMVGGNQVRQNAVQNSGIQNVGNQNGLIVVPGIANQNANQNRNGNVVAARAEGNGNGNNRNQIRCYNCKGFGHCARNDTVRPRRRDIEEVNASCILMANMQQASTSNTHADKAPIYDSDGSDETVDQNRATVEETHAYFESLYNNLVIEVKKVNTVNRKMHEANAELTTKLSRYKGNDKCFEINQEKYAKLERCYQKSVYQERCLTKKLNALQLSSPKTITTLDEEIENLNNQLSKEKAIVSYLVSYLQEERKKLKTDFKTREDAVSKKILKYEIAPIVNQVDVRVQNFEIQFLKEAAKFVRDFKSLAKKADESLDKIKVLEYENKRLLRAVVSQDIMDIVQNNYVVDTSNIQTELDRMKEKLETFTSHLVPKTQESNVVEKDKVIVPGMFRIDHSQISRVDKFVPNKHSKSTAKTRRPQPRSNTKSDRVPTSSKSSCIKNKEVEVEEHHRNLLLSKNKKNMSSECYTTKLAIQNDKYEVVCALCKQCLITTNHDVYVLNYVNGMNSYVNNQSANVSNIANKKKHKENVRKSKKSGSKERLASPRPTKPRTSLRWSPTGRIFDLNGKLIISSDSECKSDTSFLGTVRFGNDHVAAILGQFCDLDLEVAFRRNTCFVSNLNEVDLLKGNGTTNLYTINLYEMTSASPICHMARATSMDDYPRYTWVYFLRSKDEAPEVIKTFLKKIQVLLQAPIIIVRTDNVTKFTNQVLKDYFDEVGISHPTSAVKTPPQNSVVERRNQTLVEAAITMLIFSCALLFLWAEAIATACYTQNPQRTAPINQNLQTLNASTTVVESAPTPTSSSSQSPNIPNTSKDVDELPQKQHV